MLAIRLFTAAPCNAAGIFFFQAASTNERMQTHPNSVLQRKLRCIETPNRWKQHWMLQATCWNHVADDKRPSTLSFHTIFVQSLCSPKVPSKETSTTPCLAKASSNFHWYANLRFAKFPEKSPLTEILKILCLSPFCPFNSQIKRYKKF